MPHEHHGQVDLRVGNSEDEVQLIMIANGMHNLTKILQCGELYIYMGYQYDHGVKLHHNAF